MYLSIAHEKRQQKRGEGKSIEYRLKKFKYRARAVVGHAESVFIIRQTNTLGLFKVFWFLMFVKMCLQSTRLS